MTIAIRDDLKVMGKGIDEKAALKDAGVNFITQAKIDRFDFYWTGDDNVEVDPYGNIKYDLKLGLMKIVPYFGK